MHQKHQSLNNINTVGNFLALIVGERLPHHATVVAILIKLYYLYLQLEVNTVGP